MKTAVVTGTSYGIGRNIAAMLLVNGFKVYGISRTKSDIKNLNFVWINADLSDEHEIKKMIGRIREKNVDLLINNAGVLLTKRALKFNDKNFNKVFSVNFKAPIVITSLLELKLIGGLVLNTSSTSDRYPEESLSLYCSSKTALDMYFSVVALENEKIKFINILPDYVDTPMLRNLIGKDKFSWDTTIKPEKFAEGIRFIVNNQNKFETGSRVILLPNDSFKDAVFPEKLYIYNLDTQEVKKP